MMWSIYRLLQFFSIDLLLLARIDSNFMKNNCNWNLKIVTEITLPYSRPNVLETDPRN